MIPHLLDPLIENEPDEHGCRILNAEGQGAIRDFLNCCIANGVPPGVSLELLSCHDAEAGKNEPKHAPGERHFRLCLPAVSPDGEIIAILFSASEVNSDRLWVRPDELLAPIANAEAHIGDLSDAAIDLRSHQPVRGVAADIDTAARGVLDHVDLLRALHADSKRWQPIGPTAVMFGRLEAFRRPGGEGRA